MFFQRGQAERSCRPNARGRKEATPAMCRISLLVRSYGHEPGSGKMLVPFGNSTKLVGVDTRNPGEESAP
jgi:hypothetical protein